MNPKMWEERGPRWELGKGVGADWKCVSQSREPRVTQTRPLGVGVAVGVGVRLLKGSESKWRSKHTAKWLC